MIGGKEEGAAAASTCRPDPAFDRALTARRRCIAWALLLKLAMQGDALMFYSLTPDGKEDPMSMHGSCPTTKGCVLGLLCVY